MVLIVTKRFDDFFFHPECFIDMPMADALAAEEDIVTEMMKMDETIVDAMVYMRKEYSKEGNTSEFINSIPVWHTSFTK